MHPRPREANLRDKKHRILNGIFREKGCSRFALAKSLTINASMVGRYVDGFVREGVVVEDGIRGRRQGRSPVPLRLNPGYGCFLGLDFEALRGRAVLTDFSGEGLGEREVPIAPRATREAVLKTLGGLARSVARFARGRRLLSVGIAAAGQIDVAAGRVLRYDLLPGFTDVPIRKFFEDLFHVPVVVEDNVRALTFAELIRGNGRGHSNFLCVAVRSGIGVGIVIDGKIHAGTNSMAGELGFSVFPRPGGPRTLTDLVSATGIVRNVRRLLKALRPTRARRRLLDKGDSLALADVVSAAEGGEEALREELREVGTHLGMTLANLANLFAPEKLILVGEVFRCGPLVRDPMERTFRRHLMPELQKNTYLADSQLSGFGAALAAAHLAFSRQFAEDAGRS